MNGPEMMRQALGRAAEARRNGAPAPAADPGPSVMTPSDWAQLGYPKPTGHRIRVPMRVSGPAQLVFECQPEDAERFKRFADNVVAGRASLTSIRGFITGPATETEIWGSGRWWE